MGGCERAALDDAARSFHFGNVPSKLIPWAPFHYWAHLGAVFGGVKVYL